MAADGPIAAVQDALKQQKYYFGEATGELNEDTRAALRSFQNRYGLPPTGEVDTATMEMLQAKAKVAAPATQDSPDKPSEPTKATVEKDRRFLDKVEAGIEPVPPKDQTSPSSAPPSQGVPSTATAPTATPAARPSAAPAPVQTAGVPAPKAAPQTPIVHAPAQAPPAEVPVVRARAQTAPAPAVREPAVSAAPRIIAMEPEASPPARPLRPQAPAPIDAESAVAPRSAASTAPSVRPGAVQSIAQNPPPEARRPPIAKIRPAEKPPQVTNRKAERTPGASRNHVAEALPPETAPIVNQPPRTAPRMTSDYDADPAGSHGTRIIRSSGTATGPDGTTYIYEKKTTSGTPIPIRRAERGEPRRKPAGFFDRLFKDDDDD